MDRRPRCRSASPKRPASPNGSPKRHASPPKAAPDVRISFGMPNTSGRCASPRPMSVAAAAAAAEAEAAPVGWMQSSMNCIGRFCSSKSKKHSKPQQSSAVQAYAAPALMMHTMPTPKQYMTPQLAREERRAEKALEKRRMAQMKRQRALEEQQRALEEQQGALDAQKRNLAEEIIQVDESKREAFEKTLPPNVPHFAIQPCGICSKIHKTSDCPSLKKHEQKIEEQQTALEEKRRSLEEQLEEMGHLSHAHADGGAKTKRRHSKSQRSKKSKSKRSRSRSHRR